jgi:hypothetical protein
VNGQRSCAWLVPGVSRAEHPPPRPVPRPTTNGSPGISSPTTLSSWVLRTLARRPSAPSQPRKRLNQQHCSRSGSPWLPGHGIFRPRGLATSSTVCSLLRLAKPVGFAASLGFSLQGLAPPEPRRPLSGPRLSCRSKAPPAGGTIATTEVYPVDRTAEAAAPIRSNRVSGWADNSGRGTTNRE